MKDLQITPSGPGDLFASVASILEKARSNVALSASADDTKLSPAGREWIPAGNSISKIGMFLCALYLVLSVVGCGSDKDLVNHLAREVYAESQPEEPLPPKPFTSDGCSCWWDGDWVDCCVRHDLVYWMGGTSEERKQADLALMKCLERKGHSVIGRMMYMGVRVGGVWWLPTSFRWGFGWNYPETGPPGKPYE